MPVVKVHFHSERQNYDIKIAPGALQKLGAEARRCLGRAARRAAVISNQKVFELFGDVLVSGLRAAKFDPCVWLMKDGEKHKSLRSLDQAVNFLSESRVERSDAVIALGGGVVGDLAGFASAVYLRGIPFIQAPTTLLAQIDSSVGGKTGVNLPNGKNLVGAFHQPRLVIIDTDTLRTLPPRELTSGWCEAIKQGAVAGLGLFDKTVQLLRHGDERPAKRSLGKIIELQCRFKASIVENDEREDPERRDNRSRRILNFGHTTAHALEAVTAYRRFKHGEAVGYGMLVAGEISKSLGMLPLHELELLRHAVALSGPLPSADDLSLSDLMKAMTRDKKAVAGELKWVLLDGIGRPRIVEGRRIPQEVLRSALRAGLRRI